MPIFIFNKLVRDKLRDEYERLNQRAIYRTLSKQEHAAELTQKIIEEASEIPLEGSKEEVINELADIQQVIDDFAALHGISAEEILTSKQAKFAKKGGFAGGNFVETLELDTDDEWAKYYRASPDKFEEVEESNG